MDGRQLRRLSRKSLKQFAAQTVAGAVLGTAFGVALSILYWAVTALLRQPQDLILSMWSGACCGLFYAGSPAMYGGLGGATVASLRFLWGNGVFAKGFLVAFYVLLWAVVILISCLLRCQNKQNQMAIEARFSQLCLAIWQYDYEKAYTFMSPEYRQAHTIDEFKRDEEFFLSHLDSYSDEHGCSLLSTSGIWVRGSAATLTPNSNDPLELYSGPVFELYRVDGEWYFTGETSWALD